MTCSGRAHLTAHTLAGVATGRRAAKRHPWPRTRTNDEGPQCVSPWPHSGAAHGLPGQPALQNGARELRLQVGTAPSGKGCHGAHGMPVVCRQGLLKRSDDRTAGMAWQKTGKQPPSPPGARQHGGPRGGRGCGRCPGKRGTTADRRRPGDGSAAHKGSIPAGLVPAPRGPLWGRAPRTPWHRRPPGTWRPQQTPQRHFLLGTADSRRTRWTTPSAFSPGNCATASSRRTGPSVRHSDGAGGRSPAPTRSTSSPACYPKRGALP